MISLLTISPAYPQVQTKSPSRYQVVLQNASHEENRPAYRNHPYGGTLVIGTHTKPEIINPILTQTSISSTLLELIFDSLVRINNKGAIVPDLAESWDISDDGTEYTFHLKEGVLFHDGVELTAEDVQFTYESINDPGNNSPWRSNAQLIKRWEVLDKHTIKAVLKQPFGPVLYKLTREIAPKHLLENKNLYEVAFNYAPIGSGPFMFKSWNRETQQIVLKANPQYFQGRPYLDEIIIKTYADISMTWSAFMRKEVDLIGWLNKKDYAIIKDDPYFNAYAIPGNLYYAMIYNTNDSVWQDAELRKAIAYGIDVKEIIDVLSELGGKECTGPFRPYSRGHDPNIKPLGYNPVEAKTILMHQGWQSIDRDRYGAQSGVRTKDGKELELKVLVDERNDTNRRMAMMIRQQLAEIGVKVTILLYKNEDELTKEYLEQHKPQAWLRLFFGVGYEAGYDPYLSWYPSSSHFYKKWGYRNETIDQLFKTAKVTPDEENRMKIYREIHRIIYGDQPACFLFYQAFYFGISKKFKNTEAFSSSHMPYWMIKDSYIQEN